jgi:hypothetical protein
MRLLNSSQVGLRRHESAWEIGEEDDAEMEAFGLRRHDILITKCTGGEEMPVSKLCVGAAARTAVRVRELEKYKMINAQSRRERHGDFEDIGFASPGDFYRRFLKDKSRQTATGMRMLQENAQRTADRLATELMRANMEAMALTAAPPTFLKIDPAAWEPSDPEADSVVDSLFRNHFFGSPQKRESVSEQSMQVHAGVRPSDQSAVLAYQMTAEPIPAATVVSNTKPAIAGLSCMAPMEGFHSKRGSHPVV